MGICMKSNRLLIRFGLYCDFIATLLREFNEKVTPAFFCRPFSGFSTVFTKITFSQFSSVVSSLEAKEVLNYFIWKVVVGGRIGWLWKIEGIDKRTVKIGASKCDKVLWAILALIRGRSML